MSSFTIGVEMQELYEVESNEDSLSLNDEINTPNRANY